MWIYSSDLPNGNWNINLIRRIEMVVLIIPCGSIRIPLVVLFIFFPFVTSSF